MKGKLPTALLRVIAVASALALGGTFIARENAEGEKAKQREQAERAEALKEKKENEETVLIVGSKSISMPVFSKRSVSSIIESKDDSEAPIPKVLLPGSKSKTTTIFREITSDEVESFLQSYGGSVVELDSPVNKGETSVPKENRTAESPHLDNPESRESN